MKNWHKQRTILTKQLISDALLMLLKTHDINKISIRELAQNAGINRTTFYNHYGNQYDVLDEIVTNHIENTSNLLIHNLSKQVQITECLTKVLSYVQENSEFFKIILQQQHYSLAEKVRTMLPEFTQIISEKISNNFNEEEKEDIALFVQYGAVQILKKWILSDCRKSPKEEATLLLRLSGRVISIQN